MQPDSDHTAETIAAPPDAGAAPITAPEPGYPERLGRYRLRRKIGMGGMGVVFAGHDELLAREIAIKFLFRREGPSDAQSRLLREAQALARLAHPNVIAVHEVAEYEGHVFIVMEFVVGAPLRTWLRDAPRTRAEILGVMLQAGQGLAAMHAAGLVHRDVKPDNIMVGDNGRVRVMDFGLARAAKEPVAPSGPGPDDSSSSLLAVDVTRTGALLGTPGYMAPEQYHHETSTARTDIFSFCVVLFEALHGERPFVGAGPLAIREAILRGELRATASADVPRWLDAIVRRGLAADPDARWPSMPALLAALADDPDARRRRIARSAAILLLVAGVVSLLVLWSVSLARERARERAEQRAAEHLAAVEKAVRRADAAGDAPLAEATFQAFFADPAHHGTRAFAGAWQLRGDRARARDDLDAALTGYAHAYVHATADADETTALRRMAEVFHLRRDGIALGQVLSTLRAREPVDPTLALDAALLERDLPAAVAELARLPADHPLAAWRPLLGPLQGGRDLGMHARAVTPLPPGRDAAFAVIRSDVGLTLLDAASRPIDELLRDRPVRDLAAGTSWASVGSDGDAAVVDLFDPDRPLWRHDHPYNHAIRLDLPGDPGPALLVSRFAPHRGFRLLRGLGGPAPREQVAHGATERTESDLVAALVADLDGDGRDELFAAIGPWHEFSLRVFRAGEGGTLELLERRRIGRVGALAVLRRGGERLLAAFKDDSCPDPDTFPDPPHTGAPAGVHLFRWTGASLAQAGFVALPLTPSEQIGGSAFPADLDGDGVEELVFSHSGAPHFTGLVRQVAPDGLAVQRIAGMRALAAAQLDDDPAHELFVQLDPHEDLWLLGVGDASPPTLDPPPEPVHQPPSELTDPLLRERWSRASRLVSLGLRSGAAAILEETGNFALDPRAGVQLLDYAAELHTEGGDLAAALALDARIADDPEFGARALARSAAALLQRGRFEEAHAAARALQLHPARAPAQADTAASLLAELGPLVDPTRRIDLRFDEPLAPSWRIHRPGTLRRDASTGALHLLAAAGDGLLAELPIVYEGGPLALEAELDISQLEWGVCLRLDLLDEHGANWLGNAYCGLGGGGRVLRAARSDASGTAWHEFPLRVVPSALSPDRVALHVTYRDTQRTAEITVESNGHPERVRFTDLPLARPGIYRLALSATLIDTLPTLVAGALHRVSIRGAQLAPHASDPRDRSVRLLVEGEPAAALQAVDVDAAPDADLIRLLASDELGDIRGIARALAELGPHSDEPARRAALARILRTRPVATAALQADLGPALLPLLTDVWLVMRPHRKDAELRRHALVQLRFLDLLPPGTPAERAAARALLAIRGDLHRRQGDPARARHDLEAAAALPPGDDPEDRELCRQLHLQLVDLLVSDDPHAALAHAAAALQLDETPELTREHLLDRPAVAALAASDPPWRALLRSR